MKLAEHSIMIAPLILIARLHFATGRHHGAILFHTIFGAFEKERGKIAG